MAAASDILVTGAGGALGGLVVTLLAGRGVPVIAGSRGQGPVGVPGRRIDFDDPATLAGGFAGVARALIVSTDALSVPGARQRQHGAAIDAARDAGVGYLAYTSMPNPADSSRIFFAPDHVATEAMLAASGIAHGVLRNGWYQENLLAYLPQIIADGRWFTIAGDGRIPHVARADAAAAAAALLECGETGVFEIAGPRPLTNREIAEAIDRVLGRRVAIEPVDPDRLAGELVRQGVSEAMVPMVIATEASQHDRRFEVPDGDVARLTGRAPSSLEAFLRAHAGTLLARTR